MSGNHYSKQVLQLEALASSKLKQLALLEKEHELLRNKESALQNAIHTFEGPLALVKHSIAALTPSTAAEPSIPSASAAATQHPASSPAQEEPEASGPAHSGVSWGASSTHSQGTATASSYCSGDADGLCVERSGSSVTSAATGLAAASYKGGGPALLQQLNKKEWKVQQAMQRLGCCDSAGYSQLYTTELLRKAMSDPARMSVYLNMTKPERLRYWSEAYSGMALLLGKYDSNVNMAAGNVRQQLDHLVDELFERVVVCAMLDPPQKHMSCFMFNVDTHEFEQYPQGWWQQVAQGMHLSATDKAALKLFWDKQQQQIGQVAQEWEQLQLLLQQLHQQQLQSNQRFEEAIKQLPALIDTLTLAEQSRHQEKLHQQQQQQQQQQQPPQQVLLHQQQAAVTLQPMIPVQPPLTQNGVPVQLPQPSVADPALQDLLNCWRQESLHRMRGGQQQKPAADGFSEKFFAELAAELEQEQQLEQQVHALMQQQQQQGWGGAATNTLSPTASTPGYCAPVNGTTFVPMLPQQQQQQQQQHAQAPPQPGGGTCAMQFGPSAIPAGAAAAATPPHASPAIAGHMQSPSPQSGTPIVTSQDTVHDLSSGSFARAAIAGEFTHLDQAEEVLLQEGSEERRRLERRLQGVTNKMKVLHYCLLLQFTNCLTKKQLAAMCVHSHPFVFDVEGICRALDEMGWD